MNKKLIEQVLSSSWGAPPDAYAGHDSDVPATVYDNPAASVEGVDSRLVDEVARRLESGESLDGLALEPSVVGALLSLRNTGAGTSSQDTLLSITPPAGTGASSSPGGDVTPPTMAEPPRVAIGTGVSKSLEAVSQPDRYRIEREHARGGMGRILIARDNIVGREVALKELLPLQSGGSTPAYTDGSRGLAERFLREAKITGQLEHPNIVSVYEIGRNEDGSLFYTMRFVRGTTLAARLSEIAKDITLDAKQKFAARLKLLDSFIDVCNAIAYAHSRGVIHRDLKPENVMIGEYGETVVLDWGLARVSGQEDYARERLAAGTRILTRKAIENETDNLTLDGSIVGTPAYMAPEQARGELDQIDEQTDVYALGAVLYQLLSGKPPFEAPMAALIIQQVLHSEPRQLSKVAEHVPPELEALVQRAMAKDKATRLPSADELAKEIKAFRDGRTLASYQYTARELLLRWIIRHKKAVIAGTLVAYLLVSGAVWHYLSLRTERDRADQQKEQADIARRSSELAYTEARSAEQRAREEQEQANRDRRNAEIAMNNAKEEAEARRKALLGWDSTLADAYAMRVRLAMRERDFNAATAFAAAALRAAENPEARGTLMAWPRVCPLLWHIPAGTRGQQEIYEWFAVRHTPDGRHLVTGMPDGRILVIDLRTGAQVQSLELFSSAVWNISIHPGGHWIAAGDRDGNVGVFERDPATDLFQSQGRLVANGAGTIGGLGFSPSGEWLAASGSALHLFDARDFSYVGAFEGQPNRSPMNLSWSPDGRTILTATAILDDFFIRAWDVPTRRLRLTLLDLDAVNESYTAWSPDGELVASTSLQGVIRIRDGETLSVVRTLRNHTSAVLSVAFSPDSRTLASTSVDGTVRLWDPNSGEELGVLSGFDAWMTSVEFSPDGGSLCARGADGDIRLWALPTESDATLQAHDADVLDVRYSPDGTHFVTAGWDGAVSVWDAGTHARVRQFTVPFRQFFAAAFLPGNRVVGASSDGVRVWSIETGAELAHFSPRTIVTDLAVARDGGVFSFVAGRSNTVVRCADLSVVGEIGEHAQIALGCDISPDGAWIASCANDSSVNIWSLKDGGSVRRFTMPTAPAYGVAFSPDGSLLAAASEDRCVYVWDTADGSLLHILRGHEGVVFTVEFGPQGRYLFSSSQDRAIRVWNCTTGEPVAVLKGHTETVSRLAISSDGLTLLSGSQDNTVRTWHLDDLETPREQLWPLAEAVTGLAVPDKQFRASLAPDWPGEQPHDRVVAGRQHAANEAAQASLRREVAFDGYRYEDVELPDGRKVRRYFPPRSMVDGVPQGAPQGRVNFAAWRGAQHPQHLEWRKERAPQVTTISEGHTLGLKPGDFIWSIAGKRVHDREELRLAMAAIIEEESEMVVRRYRRNEAGELQPLRAPEGGLLLDENGRTQWDFEVLKLRVDGSSLGIRAGDGGVLSSPLR